MQNWQKQYLELKTQIDKTENLLDKVIEENNDLKLKLSTLKSEHEKLSIENKKLSEENIKLKERLGLNSKTSSIPSSKELYKIKKDNPKKSDKKQGAQIGHKPNLRQEMSADEVIEIRIRDTECECGGEIGLLSKPYVHQKIDIPKIKAHVKEYHLQKGRCKSCGKRKAASLPDGVTKDLFGPNIKSVIGSLGGFYKNSKRDVASILRDIFNLEISVGSISNNEARISNKCLASYEDIELELSYSKLLHIDETSHYNKGAMGWCWLFASEVASLIKLESSRGKKVLSNSVFGPDDQIIITDRYAAYNYFNRDNRQVCWSHLLRDFERFAHSTYADVKYLGEHLSYITRELFGIKKAHAEGKLSAIRFLRRARVLRKRMRYYLKTMSQKSGVLQATGMARNILKSEDMMWRFLDDPNNIPLTNNHAEQQIRHYVTYRKNSYFTQSNRGKEFLERIISLYLTWKKRGENPVKNLQNLISA